MAKPKKLFVLLALFSLLLAGIALWLAAPYYKKQQFTQMLTKSEEAQKKINWHRKEETKNISISKPLSATADIAADDLLWTFADDAPQFFAGKRFLQGRNKKCFTEVDIDGVDCIVVSQAEMDKIQQLRQWYRDNLAAKEQRRQQRLDSVQDNQACKDWHAQLPKDYEIIHLWARTGKKRDFGYQIKGDNGASKAEFVDVKINYSKQPVVLLLQNNNATVWKISYSPDTTIAAVWASGRYEQAPIGMDAGTPVLTTSYYKPRCKLHIGKTAVFPRLNKKHYKQDVADGEVKIGRYSDKWLSHGDPATLRKDPSDGLLAGDLGLQQLLHQGAIRPITIGEVAKFRKKQGKKYNDNPKDADKPAYKSYVIQAAMQFPDGMYGAHLANFYILDINVPLPTGDLAHNDITLASGYCLKCH